jgi:hypothetical protein
MGLLGVFAELPDKTSRDELKSLFLWDTFESIDLTGIQDALEEAEKESKIHYGHRDGSLQFGIDLETLPLAGEPFIPINGVYEFSYPNPENGHSGDHTLLSIKDVSEEDNEGPILADRNDRSYLIQVAEYNADVKILGISAICFTLTIDMDTSEATILPILLTENADDEALLLQKHWDEQSANDDKPKLLAEEKTITSYVTLIIRVMLAASLINMDPLIIERVNRSPREIKKAEKRGRGMMLTTTRIRLSHLRYADSKWHAKEAGTGKAWHCVRGHFRRLTSDRFVEARGKRVWVRSHARGQKRLGVREHHYIVDPNDLQDLRAS